MNIRGIFSEKNNSNIPLEEAVLIYLQEKNDRNLSRVMEEGKKLVYYFAGFYSGGPPGEDFIQVAYEGLLKAVKRFDPDRGISFATYAGHYIKGEIRHHIRKESLFYRPGVIADLQNRVDIIIDEYMKETGEMPSVDYIAEFLNVRKEGVHEILKAGLVPLEDIQLSKISSQRYESFRLPLEDKILLGQALHGLNETQRKIIYLLFFEECTQQQVGEKLGISQRKVSRILHKGLKQLRLTLSEGNSI